LAASVEFTVVERRGARSEAEQAMVEVERERERERDEPEGYGRKEGWVWEHIYREQRG